MSIILKALQKSQHERELQAPEMPPLRLDFADPEPPWRAWWPWSLAALASVVLVLAGALLWPAGEALLARFLAENPEASRTAAAPEAPPRVEAPAALPALPAAPTVAPPAEPVAQEPTRPVAPEPTQPVDQARGQPAPEAMPEAAPGPETTLASASKPDPEAPLAAAPATAAKPEIVESVPSAAPEPAPDPAPASGTASGSETAATASLEAPRQAAVDEPSGVVGAILAPRRKPDAPPALSALQEVRESLQVVGPDETPPALPAPQAVRTFPRVVVPDQTPGDAEAGQGTPEPAKPAAGITNLTIGPAVPGLRDLPAAFQDSLPKIQISVHIYDSVPGNRMVRINRQKVREGGLTVDGLRVDEITPSGLVLTYQDTQFRYPIQ